MDVAPATPAPSSRSPAGAPSDAQVTPEHPGRYDVRSELGRGGMGRVLIAFDSHVGRPVALKELLGPDDEGSAARFLNEARVTGRLEHPNIVPVYEVGRSAQGRLYYTMRVVQGRSLAQVLADARNLKARLAQLGTFWSLCNAVAFAHGEGVLHRDLKPQNVMVGSLGQTVLIDWGLAQKAGEADPALPAQPIGTPAYMSPEQVRGLAVDKRSDVWGLGAVLYEILTGLPPFPGESVESVLENVLEAPLTPVRQVCPDAPAELAAVAERALRKDPSGRYQSAAELAAEVDAYMTGGRVRAHAYTAWELIRRFVAQNRAATLGVVSAVVAILVGLVLVSASYRQERAARQLGELRLAQAYQERAERSLADLDFGTARRFGALALLHNPAHPKGLAFVEGFADRQPLASELRLQSASAVAEAGARQVVELERVLARGQAAESLLFSPDGRLLVSQAITSGALDLWDSGTGEHLRAFESPPNQLSAMVFSPDSQVLAYANGAQLQACEVASGRTLFAATEKGRVAAVAFSADGSLAVVAVGSALLLRERSTGALVKTLEGHAAEVVGATVLRDGTLVSIDRGGAERRWTLPDGRDLGVREIAERGVLSPDGALRATVRSGTAVQLVDAAGERPARLLGVHREKIQALRFSADGETLASLGIDETRLWDARSGALRMTIAAEGLDLSLALSRDGQRLALAGTGGIRLFRTRAQATPRFDGHQESVSAALLTADGKRLVSAGYDHTFREWDVDTRQPLGQFSSPEAWFGAQALDADGTRLAVGVRDGVMLWDLTLGKAVAKVPLGGVRTQGLSFSPDGRLLATGGSDKKVRLHDAASGAVLDTLEGHTAVVGGTAFSPDGTRLASTGMDGTVRLWQVATRSLERVIHAYRDWAWGVAFSPDGRLLATTGKDGQVILWDVASGLEVRRLLGHTQWVNGVAFSPDGQLLATCSDDRTVRLWAVSSGEPLLVLRPGSVMTRTSFTPDSKALAMARGASVEIVPLDLDARMIDPREVLDRDGWPSVDGEHE